MAVLSCVTFLLMIHVTAAKLLPPTNVTLNCRNTHNTLRWTYEQLTPGLKFKVEIETSGKPKRIQWVDSPALQADVSYLTHPIREYSLIVAAVIGGNESEPSEPVYFTYFQNSPLDEKCSLDLPPVDVTVESDDKVRFRFQHPWLLYQQNLVSVSKPNQKKKNKDEPPTFKYDVEISTEGNEKRPFECMEDMCENTLSVNAAQKTHCLKIRGDMEKMTVLGTQEYCTTPMAPSVEKPLIIVAGSLALIAFGVIVFMVLRKKTTSSTPLPPSMNITSHVKQWTLGNVPDKVVVPQVEPSSPTPLLTGKGSEDSTPVCTPFTEYDMRMAIGVSEDECGVTEQKKDEYMQGTDMDEEEEFNSFEDHSSYEKRQVVVELAPGEKAEGYRG